MAEREIEDPTDTPGLRSSREHLLGDARIVAWLERLRQQKVAVVLSGGGAKGAYQAGCMLALFDCDLRRFSSFAGTSVGALNAALGRWSQEIQLPLSSPAAGGRLDPERPERARQRGA